MYLLRELARLQHERGCLSDDTLRELATRENVPLYYLEGLVSFYPHFCRIPPPKWTLSVCRDVCCEMRHHERPDHAHWYPDVELHAVSCVGRCDSPPVVMVNGERLAVDENHGAGEVAHYPEGIDRDLRDGVASTFGFNYESLRSLISDQHELAEHCVDCLTAAKLRGMGGAGFPTGKKWELVAGAELNPPPVDTRLVKDDFALTPQKYVICNADESEPGTFKDREILAQLPHLVIEGMVLAGLAIGARRGIVFIRHEYEPERIKLEAELERAREAGVLGDDAAGSGQSFDVEVFVSPGGYILGEETALLECLEDKRGEPRNKPPYPGERGLWGQPTLINNVETFALATAIVHHGPDWWHAQGKEDFSGLKFVCISGDVEQPGVFEIPVGTTVAELIETAGGMKGGRALKAFLPGGASSNFLPASAVHTPLDIDAVRQAGSMLGTGAVVVFDETRDLFALATNLVRFFRNESCGKCVPCRIGSQRAVEMLETVAAGRPAPSFHQTLVELNETLEQTSICGLGQVALHPILSMLKHFPDEQPSEV